MNDSLIFRIDGDDRIVGVNDAWNVFALENDAPDLVEARVLRRSCWDFIADEATRQMYRALMEQVRAGRTISVEFRCDAPAVRRRLQMRLTPQPDHHVQFASTGLATERRAPQPLWDRGAQRGSELLHVCGWCKRIRMADGWHEVEHAVAALQLFERRELPDLTHGICPECQRSLQQT